MVPPLPRRSGAAGLPISLKELIRLGLLLPTPTQAALGCGWRRELRLPPRDYPHQPRPPVRPINWSGEARAVVVWQRRGAARRLIGYCRRGDAWCSAPRAVFG
jgi:hypothetical protein